MEEERSTKGTLILLYSKVKRQQVCPADPKVFLITYLFVMQKTTTFSQIKSATLPAKQINNDD